MFTSADDLAGKVASTLHRWVLDQAMAASRATLPVRGEVVAAALPREPCKAAPADQAEQLYRQEDIHLLSSRSVVPDSADIQIALIAGRADVEHPALQTADIVPSVLQKPS